MTTVCKHDVGQRVQDLTRKMNREGVVDLERARFERLSEEIAEQLVAHHGGVTRLASTVEDVELWRRAARRAGRILGYR